MKEHAAQVVSDEAFSKREERWSFDVPDTKEAYLIREIFDGELRLSAYCIRLPRILFCRFVPFRNSCTNGCPLDTSR